MIKDTIYRQDAIDAMRKLQRWNIERGNHKNEGLLYDDVMYLLETLQPARQVQTKRELAHWEKDDHYGECAYVCTYCETIWTTEQIKNMNFCPTCGCYMRG